MPTSDSTSTTTKSTASQTKQSKDQTNQAKSAVSSSSSTSKDTGIGWGDSYFMNLSRLRKLSFDREVIGNLASATASKDSHFLSDSFFSRLWALLPLVSLLPEGNIAVKATAHFVEPAVKKIIVAEAISSVQFGVNRVKDYATFLDGELNKFINFLRDADQCKLLFFQFALDWHAYRNNDNKGDNNVHEPKLGIPNYGGFPVTNKAEIFYNDLCEGETLKIYGVTAPETLTKVQRIYLLTKVKPFCEYYRETFKASEGALENALKIQTTITEILKVVAEMLADLEKAVQAHESSAKIPVVSPASLLAARVAEQGVAGTAVKAEPHPPVPAAPAHSPTEEVTPGNPDATALSQMSAIH